MKICIKFEDNLSKNATTIVLHNSIIIVRSFRTFLEMCSGGQGEWIGPGAYLSCISAEVNSHRALSVNASLLGHPVVISFCTRHCVASHHDGNVLLYL